MKTRFIHSFVVFIAFFLAFLMIPMDSAWAVKYTVTDLGTLGGATYGYAVNNAGQVVGSSDLRAFLWNSSTGIHDLGWDSGSLAYDINEAEEIVGTATAVVDPGGNAAVLWTESGGLQDLGSLDDSYRTNYALGINENVQIVGKATLGATDYNSAFLWTNVDGMQSICEVHGGGNPFAEDINDLGQTVGTEYNDNYAFLWSESTGCQVLDIPEGIGGGAHAINNVGQIVGFRVDDSYFKHAVLWSSAGVAQELDDLGGDQSEAYGINEAGQVVGYSTISSGSTHAFLWTSSAGMQDLNNLIGSGDPLSGQIELSEAQDTNDSGQIVANGTLTATGEPRAFLLTPIETSQEINVSLQGLMLKRASCDNLKTGQKVLVSVQSGATSANCSGAGLSVSAGDKVGIRLQGTVPFHSRNVKVTVTGFTLQSAVCENQTIKQKVTVRLKPGASEADCTAAGLRIRPRDSVGIRLLGLIPALG